MHYTTRKACDLDLFRLIELGKEYYEEASRWSNFSYDPEKIMKSAMFALRNKDHQIFMAVGEDNKVLGFLWCCITGQIFTNDPVGHDIFLFVREECRGNGIAKSLTQMFINWAKACGCKGIQAGANSGIKNDAPAINMYKSLGFEPGGLCFHLKL